MELVAAQVKLKEWYVYPIVLFAPVIEPEGPDSFLVESPEAILRKGNFNKVNWITGITDDDGAFFDVPIMTDKNLTDIVEKDWFDVAPVLFGYQHLPIEKRDSISSEIRESYFDRFEIDEFTWQSFRDLFTDRYWLEAFRNIY
ncbi:Esterase P [Orchesella cincta]|uniref:Esterase P n=1 Tax=Orchesella cincta TaxID=48709 RepID=A0A1D2MET0_ORCCI|nr:Esterase P [Orchesella cincta]